MNEAHADVIVINTCCFIHDAKEYFRIRMPIKQDLISSDILRQMSCPGFQQDIIDEIPEVDEVLGTTAYDRYWMLLTRRLQGNILSCSRSGCPPAPARYKTACLQADILVSKLSKMHCT